MTVVGFTWGGFMVPSGMASGFIGSPIDPVFGNHEGMGGSEGGGSPIEMTEEEACQLLASNKPDNCSINTYPPMPGNSTFPGWPSASGFPYAPNGCGSGSFSESVLAYGLSGFESLGFSGNLDRPIAGDPSVVFSSMCNTHDACYAGGGGAWSNKAACDDGFHEVLVTTCDSYLQCTLFADAYYDAVHYGGNEAYAEGQAGAMCSRWGHSMEHNGCDAQ